MIIQVQDEEELYILSFFKSLRDTSSKCGPLYLVGGWIRAKLTMSECFDFEIVCHKKDFKFIQQGIEVNFIPENRSFLFPVCKESNRKSSQFNKTQKFVIRLANIKNQKFKITLRCLIGDQIKTDYLSQDFTINAIYCDISTKILIDPANGIRDYFAGNIKTVCSPIDVFLKDFNLIFRSFEFAAKYNLKLDNQIVNFFKSKNSMRDFFLPAISKNPKMIFSSVRKFFCKNYISHMLSLAVDLDFCYFFLLNFKDRQLFKQTFSKLPALLSHLEISTEKDFRSIISGALPVDKPKAFLMKARLYFIAFLFYPLQPDYSFEFLRVFMYNNKIIPENCKTLIISLFKILDIFAFLTVETPSLYENNSETGQILNLISKFDFDKCSFAFFYVYFTFKSFIENHGQGIN